MIYFAPGTFNYSKKGVPNLDILKKIKKKRKKIYAVIFSGISRRESLKVLILKLSLNKKTSN